MSAATGPCALCGLRLPSHPIPLTRDGTTLHFCCAGCSHVFLLLAESGLLDGNYKESEIYQTGLRLGIIGRPETEPDRDTASTADLSGTSELVLHVDGMWCASCSWLIEKAVQNERGVAQARVLFASDTARIRFRPEIISAEQIAARIAKLGYRTSSPDSEQSPERRSLLIKMGVALFLMNNAMFFSYVLYVGYYVEVSSDIAHLVPYILFGLSLPAVFWCGLPIHIKSYHSLREGAPTMEVLFSLGIFAAFLYSTVVMLMGDVRVYFDTSISLVALLLVGKFLEMSARSKVSESIRRLYQMMPKKVRIMAPEGERLVAVEKLGVGDRFIVKSGEKIPADGIIVSGTATVDESLLTGESTPIEKTSGAPVFASSLNVSGALDVQTVRVGSATMLSGIIRMVETALTTRSPLERTVDRVVRVFIPAIIAFAVLTGVALIATGIPMETAIVRVITVLVIACPCALGMATPLGISAGIGYAAKRGILIRDSAVLQRAAHATTVVFDKTGTLTDGTFTLLDIAGVEDTGTALRLAASLEQSSNHPIATALIAAARSRGMRLVSGEGVTIAEGAGVTGIVDGVRVTVGSAAFIAASGYSIPDAMREAADAAGMEGHTAVYVGIGDRGDAGVCILGDEIRSDAVAAVALLRAQGLRVQLLSGDGERTTAAIARRAGIEQHTGHAMPADKIAFVRGLQERGEIVVMVGDGVNDAPALAQADVGIAIGAGTEIARESSAVTLLRDGLELVPDALDVARRTVRVSTQNLVWAFVYNTIGIVLAVTGQLNPFIAAIAMLVSSLTVVLNSLRLRQRKGKALQTLLEILIPWREPAAAR